MAPTEYRVIARRSALRELPSLRRAVAAGETLDGPTFEAWGQMTGIAIVDGYGQTETGHLTYPRDGIVPGSMGFELPGVDAWVEAGELVVAADTVPTFFAGYLGEPLTTDVWRTGDCVRQDTDGRLWFDSRADDVIVSSGYRIGPAEVEDVLLAHEAISDAGVLGVPDEDRGSSRRPCSPSLHLPSSMSGLLRRVSRR
jgi:acetyl-CoA synthetase